MNGSLQPDSLNSDHPTAVTNISGGVNVDANEVTIGDDAVGRDKIAST